VESVKQMFPFLSYHQSKDVARMNEWHLNSAKPAGGTKKSSSGALIQTGAGSDYIHEASLDRKKLAITKDTQCT
jgi:hypothetical protein